MAEHFIRSCINSRGVNLDNIDLIPGGGIKPEDTKDVIAFKLRATMLRQRLLEQSFLEMQRTIGFRHRCMSPCIGKDFPKEYEPGFGNFDSLLVPIYSNKEKEQASSQDIVHGENIPSEASVVEKISFKAKKSWPSKDLIRRLLKASKTRPTSYFLARFRSPQDKSYVDIEYRFNNATNEEHFSFTNGSFEKLFTPAALKQFQADLANNNCPDEKTAFVSFFPYIFHELVGRIWWNGFIVSVNTPKETRMILNTITFDPPAFVFDVTGLRNVSATRNDNRLTFTGGNTSPHAATPGNAGDEGAVHRKFMIRGRTEDELANVEIKHIYGTRLVKMVLPVLGTLSGIPLRSKSKVAKGERQIVNLEGTV